MAGACASDGDNDKVELAAVSEDGLTLQLLDGQIRGELVDGTRRFAGIRYAKAPVAELRWRSPEPNGAWDGVRETTEFVESCPQLADQGAPPSENEDCLFLNVWAPTGSVEEAPVMVWIHGGGNFSGGAGIPVPAPGGTPQLWYDGQTFAREQGVVVVTIQYRLGPLGFMAHPGLVAAKQPNGNQGLHDQTLALQWVQDNIRAFGGDPTNVTIFGESAGSADVCYHMVSPQSRGLFHRAISQSGGCTMRSVGDEFTATDAAEAMKAFGVAVGCPDDEGQLACMKKVPVDELLSNSMQPDPGAGGVRNAQWVFAAVIDGEGGFLPDEPSVLFDNGQIAKVPYLLGANHDEGNTFILRATDLPTDEQAFVDYLRARYGDTAEDIAALYSADKFSGSTPYRQAVSRVLGDAGIYCGTYDTALRAAKAGLDVYLYDFRVDWSLAPSVLGAAHAAEISHVFGIPYDTPEGTASHEVADAMNAYWARFAATGDPNGDAAPAAWPMLTETSDQRLQLAPEWMVLEDFRRTECDFWRKYRGAL